MPKGLFTSPDHYRLFQTATLVMAPPDVHVMFRASHWLDHGDLMAPTLLQMRAGPPRVGLFDWIEQEWPCSRARPGEMLLTSTIAQEYLERRWPGVAFVLLAQAADRPRSPSAAERDRIGRAVFGELDDHRRRLMAERQDREPHPLAAMYEQHSAAKGAAAIRREWFMRAATTLPEGVAEGKDVFDQLIAECAAPVHVLPDRPATTSWESSPNPDPVGDLQRAFRRTDALLDQVFRDEADAPHVVGPG